MECKYTLLMRNRTLVWMFPLELLIVQTEVRCRLYTAVKACVLQICRYYSKSIELSVTSINYVFGSLLIILDNITYSRRLFGPRSTTWLK